jgi:hypothetical protein
MMLAGWLFIQERTSPAAQGEGRSCNRQQGLTMRSISSVVMPGRTAACAASSTWRPMRHASRMPAMSRSLWILAAREGGPGCVGGEDVRVRGRGGGGGGGRAVVGGGVGGGRCV